MNDTRREVAERYRAMFMQVSPDERLKMGCRMFHTSMKLVRASIRSELGSTVGEDEVRRRVFLRLYGRDLPPRQVNAFLNRGGGR